MTTSSAATRRDDAVDDAALLALAVEVGAALGKQQWLLATAESCTGGWVAQTVTAVAGSSAWFDRGFVTYSNEAKQDMLAVPVDVLARNGTVSEPTAQAMVAGALARSRADIALSITGVAGPGGGSPAKPEGTVVIGWGTRDGRERCVTYRFEGDREAVRRQSVRAALAGVVAMIEMPLA